MNGPGPIAFVVAGVCLLAAVVWLLSDGSRKVDEALADLDDEQPVPYWPTDPTGPEDSAAWDRHCRQALDVANSATSWTALDDAQAQRWIRTHPAN